MVLFFFKGEDDSGGGFLTGIIVSIKILEEEDSIDFVFLFDGCRFSGAFAGWFFAFLAAGGPDDDDGADGWFGAFFWDGLLFLLLFFFFWAPSPRASRYTDEKVKTMVKSSAMTMPED